jgi:hypothetical protein
MTRQIFRTFLIFGLNWTSGLGFLTVMSSSPAMSQSTNPAKAGTYSFYCENNQPTSTTASYSVDAETGITFFSKQIFLAFDSALVQNYKPFFYPAGNIAGSGAIVSVNSSTVQFNANSGKISKGGLVGQIGSIRYPSGSKVPRFQIAYVNLNTTSCPTITEDTPPNPGEVVVKDQPVQLPGGYVVSPDGTVDVPSEGLKFQLLFDEAGQVKGTQIFGPNGEKLKPGQSITLPNGATITQPPL